MLSPITLTNSLQLTFSLPTELQIKILQSVSIQTLLPLLKVSKIVQFITTRKLTITDVGDPDNTNDGLSVTTTDLFKFAKLQFHSVFLSCNITDALLSSSIVQCCDQLIINCDSVLSSNISCLLVDLLHRKSVKLIVSNPEDLATVTGKLNFLQEFITFMVINIEHQVPEPLDDLDLEKPLHIFTPSFLGLPSDVILKSLTSDSIKLTDVTCSSDLLSYISSIQVEVNDRFGRFFDFDFLSHFTNLKKIIITGETDNTIISFNSLVNSLSEIKSLSTIHLQKINSELINLSKLSTPELIFTSCSFANTNNNLTSNKLTQHPTKLTLIDCHFNFFEQVKLPISLHSLNVEFNTPQITIFEISDLINLRSFTWYNYSIEFPLTLHELPPNLINLSTNITKSQCYHKLCIPDSVKHLQLDIQLNSPLHNTLLLPLGIESLIVHSKHLESDLTSFENLRGGLKELVKLELWDKKQGCFTWLYPPVDDEFHVKDLKLRCGTINEVLVNGYQIMNYASSDTVNVGTVAAVSC